MKADSISMYTFRAMKAIEMAETALQKK